MKKNIIILIIIVFTTTIVTAQTDTVKYWKTDGRVGFNFAQGYLSNWAAGGTSSLNTQGYLQYKANYAKENAKWDNSFDFLLGYSIFGDEKPMKTDDRLELNSLYGLKITDKLFSSLAFSFKTQTNDGFDYKVDSTTPISKLFSPAYVTLGIGAEWSPNKIFSVNIAPFTARGTFVIDQALADKGAYGVRPAKFDSNGVKIEDGQNFRFEFGGKLLAKINMDIAKNVNFQSKFELFSDYLKNPQNVDVDWQNQFTMKINSWLNASIMAQLIYDDDINITDKDGKTGPRTQFKEMFSLGLSYILK
ncbi:MAG: DUF3078 domain-containing protein [Bacteroidales bacterium]|nr:DUF3078 domain-containing protein [Bacteroidales bacterium]